MERPTIERWDRGAQWPLLVVSLVFVAAYAWPILDPTLSRSTQRLCSTVVWVTWAILAGEFATRWWLAPRKLDFLRHHPLDLAAALLPLFRPLRLLRLLSLLTLLDRVGRGSLRGRVGLYVAASVTLIVLTASLAVLDAERGGPGPIQNYGDALWWSIETVTTVGYGDMYPVTVAGRVVAAMLMLTGIGVLGVVTASFASWLVQRVEQIEEEERGEPATVADVALLREEVRRLREELERRRA
ncbi:potassium channel family protein [Nocardioides aequoreus]|uniref:potassium channel family protein n=1 Tax=Nocardioides aequoreus TaxID=397278 RepID=UPI0004C4609B|nr:potassium channel family protein [Nocardioides aequoreus]